MTSTHRPWLLLAPAWRRDALAAGVGVALALAGCGRPRLRPVKAERPSPPGCTNCHEGSTASLNAKVPTLCRYCHSGAHRGQGKQGRDEQPRCTICHHPHGVHGIRT